MLSPDEHVNRCSAGWAALAAAAVAGDADALTRLLALHHERLLEHTVRKVGTDWRGRIDPEDVLQEAYLDVFAGIPGFRPGGPDSFYHWAAAIVDRRYIDQIRRHRAQKRDINREVAPVVRNPAHSTYHGLLEQCVRDSRTPSRFAATAEAVSTAMSALARLPEDYRLVLRRHYLAGEPLAAIAADLQRTEDAVRRLATRALERLRQLLDASSS